MMPWEGVLSSDEEDANVSPRLRSAIDAAAKATGAGTYSIKTPSLMWFFMNYAAYTVTGTMAGNSGMWVPSWLPQDIIGAAVKSLPGVDGVLAAVPSSTAARFPRPEEIRFDRGAEETSGMPRSRTGHGGTPRKKIAEALLNDASAANTPRARIGYSPKAAPYSPKTTSFSPKTSSFSPTSAADHAASAQGMSHFTEYFPSCRPFEQETSTNLI